MAGRGRVARAARDRCGRSRRLLRQLLGGGHAVDAGRTRRRFRRLRLCALRRRVPRGTRQRDPARARRRRTLLHLPALARRGPCSTAQRLGGRRSPAKPAQSRADQQLRRRATGLTEPLRPGPARRSDVAERAARGKRGHAALRAAAAPARHQRRRRQGGARYCARAASAGASLRTRDRPRHAAVSHACVPHDRRGAGQRRGAGRQGRGVSRLVRPDDGRHRGRLRSIPAGLGSALELGRSQREPVSRRAAGR